MRSVAFFPKHGRGSAAVILLLVLLTPLMLLGVMAFFASRPPTVGERLPAAEAPLPLPSGAREVSFYLPPAFGASMAYEFTAPEEEVVRWATASGWPLTPINDEGVLVYRYLSLLPNSRNLPEATVKIARGLCYRWSFKDQSRVIAFDRDTGRAYAMIHTR